MTRNPLGRHSTSPASRAQRLQDWMAIPGRDMNDWEPFTGLEMYEELLVGGGLTLGADRR